MYILAQSFLCVWCLGLIIQIPSTTLFSYIYDFIHVKKCLIFIILNK